MLRGVFEVIADGFKFRVIACDENEVKEHCFKCFDYTNINIKYLNPTYVQDEHPQFIGKVYV